MKRIILGLLALAAVLSFVGCTDSGGNSGGALPNYNGYTAQANTVYQAPVTTAPVYVPAVTEAAPATTAVPYVATMPEYSDSSYEKLFSNRYIIDIDEVFFGLESKSFAAVQDDMLDKIQLGYEGDIVKTYIETMYVPVSDMTEAEKSAALAALKEFFAPLEAESYCIISYDMGSSWLVVKLELTDLDKVDDWTLINEFLDSDIDGLISLKATEESYLNDGYFEK